MIPVIIVAALAYVGFGVLGLWVRNLRRENRQLRQLNVRQAEELDDAMTAYGALWEMAFDRHSIDMQTDRPLRINAPFARGRN